MYPGMIVEWDDQSDIVSLPIAEVRNMPLFGAIFTSDKGTEEWTRISGKDFFKMYGDTISFTKHGQPLLQAAMSINSGAELLCKRLVADDSTLANISVIAEIVNNEKTEQAKDAEGNLIYLDDGGNETTENTGKPKMITTSSGKTIKYTLKSVSNVSLIKGNTIDAAKDIAKAIKEEKDSDEKTLSDKNQYLLYTIVDNGRGTSKKRIKILPNYKLSKSIDYCSYVFYVIEGSRELESIAFSTNTNLIVNGENISLQNMINNYSTQVKCIEDIDGINKFAKALSEINGATYTDGGVHSFDLLFGKTNKGTNIDGISVDITDGKDLSYSAGQALENGTNGSFGDRPVDIMKDEKADDSEFYEPSAWGKAAKEALDGTFDKSIFNVDLYKIDAWVDANYPNSVKREIETLAGFREDFIYFRDQGLDVDSYDKVKDNMTSELHSMFVSGSYYQSYDIIDPYTKRQIRVTMGYDLAQLLVNHLNNNGAIMPFAGLKYKFVVTNAIYGTVSHIPTICPDNNEKEEFDDLKVNYATYIDNNLVIETEYTSQEKYSQWSFINNVMGIQEVVKVIRSRCPLIRYSFIDGEDLKKYKRDVEQIIEPYSNDYRTLSLEYISDATYSANKIFYAALKVKYKDFIQTEWFKVTALSSTEVVEE